MLGFLDAVWRVADLLASLWDLILNWRLILCILVALGVVFGLREGGVDVGTGALVFAALIGLVTGLAWELLSAASRRGYI
jgi:hypothetical protein